MRICFIGCVEFSKCMLEELINNGGNIVSVVTKKNSKFNSDFYDLSQICIDNSINYITTDDINSDSTVNFIINSRPDYIFCFGWSSLLKKDILDICPVIGYHPAKLPMNRGRHPLIWALVLGLESSSSTFFFMNLGADDGDIISQVDFDILYEDDARSIYNKIISIAKKQIKDIYDSLLYSKITCIKQDISHSNVWRKRSKIDGKIDFRMSSNAIYNLVRALTRPYVGAHVEYKGNEIKIWSVREVDCTKYNIESGKVLDIYNGTIVVKTCDKAIEIREHQFTDSIQIGEYL